jgi:hypothetical protein
MSFNDDEAYFSDQVVNNKESDPNERNMTTGRYVVGDTAGNLKPRQAENVTRYLEGGN